MKATRRQTSPQPWRSTQQSATDRPTCLARCTSTVAAAARSGGPFDVGTARSGRPVWRGVRGDVRHMSDRVPGGAWMEPGERVAAPEIITRKEAQARGLIRYFTGTPCIHGHIDERNTSTAICIPCGLKHRRGYYAKDPKRGSRKSVEWAKANPEKAKAKVDKWVEENRERSRAIKKKWAANNPDLIRADNANKRARRRNADGKHTAAEIKALLQRQKGKCANPLCKVALGSKYHRDHIVPLIRGGTNHIKNIQLLCKPCNMRKGSKDPIAWSQQNGLLL